jgi:hypothetical protein
LQYHSGAAAGPSIIGHWKWQQAAPPAWDISALAAHPSIGGYWVQYFPTGWCAAEHFGAKGDYDLSSYRFTTLDNAAIQAAMLASVNHGLTFKTIRPNAIRHTDTNPSLSIRMPAGLDWRFEGNGAIILTTSPMGPWFYYEGATGGVKIVDGQFCFNGEIPRAKAIPDTFPTGYRAWWSARRVHSVTGFMGRHPPWPGLTLGLDPAIRSHVRASHGGTWYKCFS